MYHFDFEYDGLRLSDFGYVLCEFDSSDKDTVSNGSQITFNTVSTLNGSKYELTSSTYDTCLEATFQLCKNPVKNDVDEMEISVEELKELMSWLNRKEFHKFRLLDNEFTNCYFEVSFNIKRIESNTKVIGLELDAVTNRPFALMEPVTIVLENDEENGEVSINDLSDDEGYIYPTTTITLKSDGDLTIYNCLEERSTYIANCTNGEVITMDYPVITTSDSSHQIQNDFNWNFFRIAGTYADKENNLIVSLPCTIEIEYSPIVKVGI